MSADEQQNDEQQDETDALVSRLKVIEDQALESRAAAFAQVHDELQAKLESGDAPRQDG